MHDAERHHRLKSRLLRRMSRASRDHKLIEPGDKIMVAVSGGKDSYTMLHLMRELQKVVPFEFDIVAVNLDQQQPGFPAHILEDYLKDNGYPYKMLKEDTYSIVLDKTPAGKAYCSMCSRLRRGILYNAAVEMGCTKIALGHHRDDASETLMLNLLYAGQIKAMPPWLQSDDGRNVVIRPLIYCAEDDIAEFAALEGFPILPCNLCGSQENLKRKRVKELLTTLNDENPNVRGNVFAALANVRPTHLLDRNLRELMGTEKLRGFDEGVAALEGGGGCA